MGDGEWAVSTPRRCRHTDAPIALFNGPPGPKGKFTFADGTLLEGTFLKRCSVRG